GVYSWVSPENRRILVELLRRRLKPGGVAYVSYNALPGQAAEAPLARLIRDHAMAEPGPIPARLDRALAFAGRLRQAGAAYFAMAPAAGPHLDGLQGQTRNYLAHEYLNSHRTAFYHADIAAELAEAKLDFAASALLLGQFDNLNLSPEQQALLAEVGDPARRETLRDFILGQGFRRDLFQRGLRPLAPAEAAARLRATRFALVTPRRQMPRTAACPRGQIAFAPAVYDPLLDALAEGPQPLAALEARTGLPWEPLREAILLLCAAGHAEPAVAEAEADSARDSTARFNAAVLEENGKGVELMALASPVLGTGVAVDRADRLFLAALQRGADPLAFARAALPPPPSDNPADDPLPRRFEIFETLHLPILRQLGVA
ncbi:MAG TPA: methyltransferase regulatory domain-containing protein, partial [Alphaproteobacteria bacterium]|nr:methyltransferase regulatory domain-containing protein [Alphaproteobacteria bacterium]